VKRFARITGFAALAILVSLTETLQAQEHHFIWRASKAGSSVVYFVGSVHMLTKDYYPLSPVLDQAFAESNLLVEEADLGEMLAPGSQLQLLSKGMLAANQSLDRVVKPATYALVAKHVGALGMPLEPLKRFKPWFLSLTILGLEWQKAGFDPDLGLDKHFYDRAQTNSTPVQGLETVAYQLSRFDEMPMDEQDRMLAESLSDLETERENVTRLADAWRAGDAPTVEQIVLQGLKDDPAIYQRLLVDRNRNWLPAIEALFTRPGRTFVVVGAAHLVGPDGLIAVLKAKGYQIQQL